jgi:uncharacterized protein YndB with AHSA1/START domain
MQGTEANGWELSVERAIAAPPSRVWQAMTGRLPEWWCPKPWRTEVHRIEWRSGGPFEMVMRGPETTDASPILGVLLEVVPERRFVFSDMTTRDWIPKPGFMIGCFELEPRGSGTRVRGWSRHWDEAAMKKHLEMGFTEGWSIVLHQLAALVEA